MPLRVTPPSGFSVAQPASISTAPNEAAADQRVKARLRQARPPEPDTERIQHDACNEERELTPPERDVRVGIRQQHRQGADAWITVAAATWSPRRAELCLALLAIRASAHNELWSCLDVRHVYSVTNHKIPRSRGVNAELT